MDSSTHQEAGYTFPPYDGFALGPEEAKVEASKGARLAVLARQSVRRPVVCNVSRNWRPASVPPPVGADGRSAELELDLGNAVRRGRFLLARDGGWWQIEEAQGTESVPANGQQRTSRGRSVMGWRATS